MLASVLSSVLHQRYSRFIIVIAKLLAYPLAMILSFWHWTSHSASCLIIKIHLHVMVSVQILTNFWQHLWATFHFPLLQPFLISLNIFLGVLLKSFYVHNSLMSALFGDVEKPLEWNSFAGFLKASQLCCFIVSFGTGLYSAVADTYWLAYGKQDLTLLHCSYFLSHQKKYYTC